MKARIHMTAAMLIFGSVGLFVRNIALPSGMVALSRGVIGCLMLLAAGVLTNRRISWNNVKKNGLPLLLSGAAVGFNWIFLFEAYRYTTVARATLSYYFAPVLVILLSPLVLKERLTVPKAICAAIAAVGMTLVAGVFGAGQGGSDFTGIALGLTAAALYAAVMILNKFIKGLTDLESTAVQLAAASAVLLPYVLLKGQFPKAAVPAESLIWLLAVGVLHTGIAYLLYFSAIGRLPGQTTAVLSYIDPVTAVILSFAVLREPMTWLQAAGAVLILGVALLGELFTRPAAVK